MSYFFSPQHDAVSPDGFLLSPPKYLSDNTYEAQVQINNIDDHFLGFSLPKENLTINLKSSLAQLGVEAIVKEIMLDRQYKTANISLLLKSYGPISKALLSLMLPGNYILKLFAEDSRRLVKKPDYLQRVLSKTDRFGLPLLSFGNQPSDKQVSMEVINGRLIAFLPVLPGVISYEDTIYGFLPFLCKSLSCQSHHVRKFLKLYQKLDLLPQTPKSNDILLIKTAPLHIRTVFARVVNDLLPKGTYHTAANILQPDTTESGDIYELYGNSDKNIDVIPLEFFTIEPHKEHSFFVYRDLLKDSLSDKETVFNIFTTAPQKAQNYATFISKGGEISHLNESSWLTNNFDSQINLKISEEQHYPSIQQQPCFPFLHAMESGSITSQGVLFTKYFPSTLLKSLLLSYFVKDCLMQIYFQRPSYSQGSFFSQRDRAMLLDLYLSGIKVFWVDDISQKILRYTKRKNKDAGMFVPIHQIDDFKKACFFGIYGSHAVTSSYDGEILKLLEKLVSLSKDISSPLFGKDKPLALVTGGGPGVMASGNQMAQQLGILSCANIVDFESSECRNQPPNPHVEAKMTYRLGCLIERQDHFHLDFPIFVVGGMGTDFEMALELLSLKAGKKPPVPILLFGPENYWKDKLAYVYQANLEYGTIKGSDWVSNCLYCVNSSKDGLEIYQRFFQGKLPIGPQHPSVKSGFVTSLK